jgi:hypothetical protein
METNPVAGFGECGYESSGTIRAGNFLRVNIIFLGRLPYQLGLPADDDDDDDDDDDESCIMAKEMEFTVMLMIIRTIYSETQFSYESTCLSP